MRFLSLFSFLGILIFVSCQDDNSMNPKPRSYPRINFPVEKFNEAVTKDCPFSFKKLKSSHIESKKIPDIFEVENSDCFFNLIYPELNATIYFSYFQLEEKRDLERMVSDSYRIANEINKRSDYMEEFPIHRGDVHGMLFDFYGPSASPMQFILTDSTNHFVRSALYINDRVDVDSLQPIVTFLENDILRLIGTLEWNKN